MLFNCLAIFASYVIFSTLVEESLEDESPFKMGKVNVVWNKAQKVLDGNRLTDLYADLVIQDKRERDLKKRKFDGIDKAGLFEADVRQHLVDIIRKYGLSEFFPNSNADGRRSVREDGEIQYEIRDDRLKKILKNARKEGFTDTEIQLLKEELGHHQVKLDEYNSLKTDYEELEEQVDNSLDNLDEQEKVWSELAQKKKEMKNKHKEFRDGVKRIETKLVDRENVAGKFEDPRVYKLWALAKKAVLDEAELESVRMTAVRKIWINVHTTDKNVKSMLESFENIVAKEEIVPVGTDTKACIYGKELTHFESRIRKAEYVQNQLEQSKNKMQAGAAVDVNVHADLEEKAKVFNKKVDKYHKYLEDRIHRHIDEL